MYITYIYILLPCIKLPTTKLELSRIASKARYMTQLKALRLPNQDANVP